jgi:hypothetical protein
MLLVAASCLLAPLTTRSAEERSPITLRAAATIDREGSVTSLVIDSNTFGIPVDYGVNLISTGGIFVMEVGGDVVATWDSTTVIPGNNFDLDVDFEASSADLGLVRVEYDYFLRPFYSIDFDALFHDTSALWKLVDPNYPLTGTQIENFTLPAGIPDIEALVVDNLVAGTDSLFLLGGSHQSSLAALDTLNFSYDEKPYPCIRIQAQGKIITSMGFDVVMDTLCVRYAPDSDTLCWQAGSGFDCQTDFATWEYSVPVYCQGATDVVVPLCPIKGSVGASVQVRTELVLSSLSLSYTCIAPNPTLPAAGTPSTDTTWVDAALSFGTDRDDYIFDIDTIVDSINVFVKEGSDTLANKDTLHVGTSYTVVWDQLGSTLDACCTSDSLRVFYRDIDNWDPDFPGAVCEGEVDGQVGVSPGSGFSWNVPNETCFDGRNFKMFLEIFCPASGDLIFFNQTDTLIIVGGVSGG